MTTNIKKIVHRFIYIYCRLVRDKRIYFRAIGLKIGKNCRIYTNRFGSEPYLITIGDNVTITAGVTFITHDGSGILMNDSKGRRYRFQPIRIGNDVFVGSNSIIMPGVRLDDNVIVAAGSVITKSVPAGSIVAGVPAQIIGQFADLKLRMISEYISDKDFKKLSGNERDRILKATNYSFKPYL